MAVFGEHVSKEAQLRRLAAALAIQQRLRVGARDVGLPAALLAVEVHFRVAATATPRWVILVAGAVALLRRPRLEERPVHAEVVVRQQPAAAGLRAHRKEELTRDVVRKQARPVLRERRRIERLVADVQVQEPFEQQVVLQPLAELPLAAHREQRDQQAGLEQVLRWDRRPPDGRVHRPKDRRKLTQHPVYDRLDTADGMVLRHQLVWREGRKDDRLLRAVAAHGAPPIPAASPILQSSALSRDPPPVSFSAAC